MSVTSPNRQILAIHPIQDITYGDVLYGMLECKHQILTSLYKLKICLTSQTSYKSSYITYGDVWRFVSQGCQDVMICYKQIEDLYRILWLVIKRFVIKISIYKFSIFLITRKHSLFELSFTLTLLKNVVVLQPYFEKLFIPFKVGKDLPILIDTKRCKQSQKSWKCKGLPCATQ